MPFYLKKLLAHGGYMDEAGSGDGSGGSAGGGGGAGGEGGQPAGGAGAGGEGGSGGKPSISDSEAALLREVMDKKNKLKATNEQLEQANAKLKEFEGLDPAEIRKLVKEQREAQARQLEAQGNWEALKKQMNDSHDAAIAAERAARQAVEAELAGMRKTIADQTVGSAFDASTFIRDKLTLPTSKARAIFGAHFEFDATAGRVVGYDKPTGAANRVQLVDGRGEPLGFEEAISKLVDADPDRDRLLKPTMRPGAGSRTDNSGGAPTKTQTVSGLDRIAAGLKGLK